MLAVSAAIVAGCHGGESPQHRRAVANHAGAGGREPAATGSSYIRSTGTVHARETAVVSAQVMGRIQQVLVREGDSVRAGQTLVVLDDAALRASVEQAQAGVKAAQNAQAAAQTECRSWRPARLERYRQLAGREERKPAGDG